MAFPTLHTHDLPEGLITLCISEVVSKVCESAVRLGSQDHLGSMSAAPCEAANSTRNKALRKHVAANCDAWVWTPVLPWESAAIQGPVNGCGMLVHNFQNVCQILARLSSSRPSPLKAGFE